MAGFKRSFVTLQIYSNNLGLFGPNLVQINVFEGFRATTMTVYTSVGGKWRCPAKFSHFFVAGGASTEQGTITIWRVSQRSVS